MKAPKNLLLLSLLGIALVALTNCEKEEGLPASELKDTCRTGVSAVRKVLFIGMDGCRTDALLAARSAPFDSLMAHAYVNLHCDRGPYTVSGPGWSTLLHGVFPAKHGVTSNDFSDLDYGMYHDLFYYMRQANPDYSLATVTSWDDFLRMTTNEDYAQVVDSDNDVKDRALYLLQNCVPDVLLLHFDDVDYAGHQTGFSPTNPEYITAIQQVEGHVAELMDAITLREQTYGEEWMVVLVTDHGGEGTSHGDQDHLDVTRYVFEVVRIPGLARTDIPVATNADIMPTILHYMNVSVAPAWSLDGSSIY